MTAYSVSPAGRHLVIRLWDSPAFSVFAAAQSSVLIPQSYSLRARLPIPWRFVEHHSGSEVAAADRFRHAFKAHKPDFHRLFFQRFDGANAQNCECDSGLAP